MENLASSTIVCPQCAGENQIQADEKFIECSFCGSAIYIDKSKVVTHYVVNSNFKQQEAEGNLRRWMAGNFQVKDLDKLAQISNIEFFYFPLWYFKVSLPTGDVNYIQPGTSTAISEIKKLNIPAGNLKVYNKTDFNEQEFIQPDVLIDSAKNWLKETGVDINYLAETDLVHIPLFKFTYAFENKQYTAYVEASSGMVYANQWPAKSETPYRLMFGVSIAVYAIMAIIAVAISEIGSRASIGTFEFIKIFGFLLVTAPLIFIAYLIAKKV
jgi:hypothetical protein